MKKLIAGLFTFFMIFSLNSSPVLAENQPDTSFGDIAITDWYSAYVQTLADLDVISGYTDSTFRPEASISRAEFLAAAMKAQGYQLPAAREEHWAINYVHKAEEIGVLEETEIDITGLDEPVTRAEAARLLVRTSGVETTYDKSSAIGQIEDFFKVPEHFQPYVAQAYDSGWIAGYPDETFRPDKNVTRAEAAVMLSSTLGEQAESRIREIQEAAKNLQEKQNGENRLRENILETARNLMGTPYRYGGNSPSGFDCSGFVNYVFSRHGIDLPRSSSQIYHATTRISFSELRPGDLVFFQTYRTGASHVGIYTGNGEFIHAPSSGRTVSIDSVYYPYWNNRLYGASRVI